MAFKPPHVLRFMLLAASNRFKNVHSLHTGQYIEELLVADAGSHFLKIAPSCYNIPRLFYLEKRRKFTDLTKLYNNT